MARGRITKKAVAQLCGEALVESKDQWLCDTGRDTVKGFGIRASASGRVFAVYQFWAGGRGGKARRMMLGELHTRVLGKEMAGTGP